MTYSTDPDLPAAALRGGFPSLAGLLRDAIALYRVRPTLFLKIMLPALIAGMLQRLPALVLSRLDMWPSGGRCLADYGMCGVGLFIPISWLVVKPLAAAALVGALGRRIAGTDVDLRSAYTLVYRRAGGFLLVLLSMGVCSGLPLTALYTLTILGGFARSAEPFAALGFAIVRQAVPLLVAVRLGFAVPAVLLTPLHWSSALRHSLALTRGRFVRLALIAVPLVYGVWLAEWTAMILLAGSVADARARVDVALAGFGFELAGYLYAPFAAAFFVLLWCRLRSEDESLSYEMIRQEIRDGGEVGASREAPWDAAPRLARSRRHRRRYPG